jgi:hypothetical protein
MAVQTGELKAFVATMEANMQRLGAPSVRDKDAFLRYQADQVARMLGLEHRFREALFTHGKAQAVYEAFVLHAFKLSSILSARSYFRERQDAFLDVLGPALEGNDWRKLAEYRINFRFVGWAMTLPFLRAWPQGGTFAAMARRIEKLRGEMVLLLMPLAISRARIFWGRTPASHLSLSDLTQIAFEGLMTAVDKYVPDPVTGFSSVYRGVAIGRITGNLIEGYSQTLLHFFPQDRKILYRANKRVGRMVGGADYERLAADLNAHAVEEAEEKTRENPEVLAKPAFRTDADEVAGLMAASSHVSADAVVGGARKVVMKMIAPEEQAPDRQAELREGLSRVLESVSELTIMERKMLCLKGMIEPEDV